VAKAAKQRPSDFQLLGLMIICAVLVGCVDFGHTGTYNLVLRERLSTSPSGQSTNELQNIVRQTLFNSGFKEETGQRTIWLKDGATVILKPLEGGAISLKLTSMGSANRVRAATQVETELVEALKQSHITVTPTTPY
jgi:hypothetical protein